MPLPWLGDSEEPPSQGGHNMMTYLLNESVFFFKLVDVRRFSYPLDRVTLRMGFTTSGGGNRGEYWVAVCLDGRRRCGNAQTRFLFKWRKCSLITESAIKLRTNILE